MNKAELEKKPLSELHLLAAEAGVPKFRMLPKSELVEQLAGGNGAAAPAGAGGRQRQQSERKEGGPRKESERKEGGERPRRRRRRPAGSPAVSEEIEKGGAAEP